MERPDVPYRKIAEAGPKTAGFMASSFRRAVPFRTPRYPDVPTRPTTFAMMAGALADELALATMASDRLVPTDSDLKRIRREVTEAIAVLDRHGWLDKPAGFHTPPEAPADVRSEAKRFGRVRYEHITFPSGFEPVPDMPGADRWRRMSANRTMHAYVLRHRHGERPWIVNIHGFSMGVPSDLEAFRALHFHRDKGYNVLFPVLPLHGPRRSGKRSGDEFITMDFLNNVHGMAQAVWDVRRTIAWARDGSTMPTVVHGVSLGAYTGALLAGLDGSIDGVIAGIPAVDLPYVMRTSVPADALPAIEATGLLGEDADLVHRVVAPLAFECQVPHESRFIYAGVADRMAKPESAARLWRHWGEPSICWYGGSHVGFALSREVRRFVAASIAATTT